MIFSRLIGRLIVLSGAGCILMVACALMLGGTMSSWQITYRVFTSPYRGWSIRTLDVERHLNVEWIYVPANGGGISLSPNRQLVMFEVGRADNSRVWVLQDRTQRDLHNVHIDNPTISQPQWSPDSTHIAYYQDGQMLIAPIGQPETPVPMVLNSPALIASTTTWSADSQTLRFVTATQTRSNVSLIIVNRDTSIEAELLLEREILIAQWSPDRQSFAFVDADGGLYILNPDVHSSPQFITQLTVDSRELYWSPDNTQLAVISRETQALTTDISVVNLTTNEIQPLISTPTAFSSVLWAPDSTRLALINYYTPNPLDNGVAELTVLSLAEDERAFSEPIGIDRLASDVHWSPDSTRLLYHDELTQQLMIVNVDGSNPYPLDNNPTTTYWIMP